jgi:hypothetical protein
MSDYLYFNLWQASASTRFGLSDREYRAAGHRRRVPIVYITMMARPVISPRSSAW